MTSATGLLAVFLTGLVADVLPAADLATTPFLDAGAFATGFGATFAFTAVLAFAADLAAGLAAGFLSALRATEAALEGLDFAVAFLDFEAVLAMVLNQSARGDDREMCRVTPRFRDVAQAARRYLCR